jgi:ribose transport system permease protein
MKCHLVLNMDLLRKYAMLLILVILVIFFSFGTEYFLKTANILNILRQGSVLAICVVGLTFVMLTGGIDLSIGSVIGLASVVAASCMVKLGLNPVAAIFLALVTGSFVGMLNGFLVTYVNIPPLIATLGTMTSIRGLCYILTGGLPVYNFPAVFNVIGKGYVSIVPIPVIIMVIIMIIGWYVLNKTRYGRYLYAIGGNKEAARLSGVNVKLNMVLTYTYCGLLSAAAGLIELSRLSSGQPNAGNGFEMSVITSVVLGGVSVNGGEGKFMGVVLGIFIMGVLTNGLVMMNVFEYYQQLIRGLVLLFAVGFDQVTKMRLTIKKAA